MTAWNPRGEPTWPNWREADPGTRVRHVRSGHTATFIKPSNHRNNGAIVDWDDKGFGVIRACVVSPAYDLEVIPEGEAKPVTRRCQHRWEDDGGRVS